MPGQASRLNVEGASAGESRRLCCLELGALGGRGPFATALRGGGGGGGGWISAAACPEVVAGAGPGVEG